VVFERLVAIGWNPADIAKAETILIVGVLMDDETAIISVKVAKTVLQEHRD